MGRHGGRIKRQQELTPWQPPELPSYVRPPGLRQATPEEVTQAARRGKSKDPWQGQIP